MDMKMKNTKKKSSLYLFFSKKASFLLVELLEECGGLLNLTLSWLYSKHSCTKSVTPKFKERV